MKIYHLRNATLILEVENKVILVDPMLGKKGTIPTFTYFRFKAQKNPIVPLPKSCQNILDKVTHCIITHQHPDHIDKKGESFLIENKIPVFCSKKDEIGFLKKGLPIIQTIDYWNSVDFLDGKIEGIPARHGYGFVAKPMGNVMGFYIKFPNQPSIYLSSDTIYTNSVEKVLKEYKPDISIVASGTAQLDIFKPLLMTIEDIVKFVKNAPGKVICNHLEAVNHCPTTRKKLKKVLKSKNLMHKVIIPNDGEAIEF